MGAGQYFEKDPAVPSRPGLIELALPDFRAELQVDRGVFSAGGVDPGTLIFLKTIPPPPEHGHLLDLGCGYGPVACTLAQRAPGATVWAVDVNERALALTAANAASLGLAGVRAVRPEDVPGHVQFAGIWSNPPIRIGKDALRALLLQWLMRLGDGAHAWLVVQRNLGSDTLAAWLSSVWEVERLRSKRGYRILKVSRP